MLVPASSPPSVWADTATVERSIAWLGSYRRLNVRWERKASTFLAMLGIACILICYKHLAKHANGF